MHHSSSSKAQNFQVGLLMTVLIGAAFIIHRQAQQDYLAGGNYQTQRPAAVERVLSPSSAPGSHPSASPVNPGH